MYNYKATKIGAIFTAVCLLLTLTFVVPVFSIIPGAFIESMVKLFVDNNPYSNVGMLSTILLGIIFIATLVVVLIKIKRASNRIDPTSAEKEVSISTKGIILIMLLFYLIVHPLGFYLYWWSALDFRSDGQLIMEAIRTYPISSLSFIVIGYLIDIVKD